MSYVPGLFENGRPVKKNNDRPGPRSSLNAGKKLSERELQEWDFDHPQNLDALKQDGE